MKSSVKANSFLSKTDGIFIFGMFKKSRAPKWISELPANLSDLIKSAIKEDSFEGDFEKTLVLRADKKSKIRKIVIVGLGEKKEWNEDRARKAAGTCRSAVKSFGIEKATMALFGNEISPEIAKAQVEGFCLAGYKFDKYKTNDKKETPKKEIGTISIINQFGAATADLKKAVDAGNVIADAANYARNLQAEPGNSATPTFLAAEARKIARSSSKIKVKVLDFSAIKKLKMGAFIGVAQGSKEPPKFIIFEYKGASAKTKPIALVGKGITFDAGGISLKTPGGMEDMKYDMSGAAAVFGVFKALSKLDLKKNIIGLVPATENLPSGSAQKPGDIIKAFSGKTIEIINTDAEGRLVLADALAYAVKNYKPTEMIDLATLTGAIVVSLGSHGTGLFSNDRVLTDKLKKASETTGEKVWEFPMWDEYHEMIKSDFADMKNIGGREGGSITAAVILDNFVGDTPWVHLDIAGTAYIKTPLSYAPKGPTGVGVRLLMEYIRNN